MNFLKPLHKWITEHLSCFGNQILPRAGFLCIVLPLLLMSLNSEVFAQITCGECPDILLPNDPSLCGAVVDYVIPIGSDNCPGFIAIQTAGMGS